VAAYGTTENDTDESKTLMPTTLYGHAKNYGETWTLARNQDDFICAITRSASVCGYAPALRTDLTVNKMVHDAVRKGVITVNGGSQKRCHVHIRDLVDFYRLLLKAPAEKINGKAFNVVAENATVMQTANLVSKITGADIEVKPATDDRSYTVSGERAAQVLGFRPKRTVSEAVQELTWQFRAGYWPDTLTNPAYQRMADNLA
jgi:nucleoside-diphosphate-sugar epimerase